MTPQSSTMRARTVARLLALVPPRWAGAMASIAGPLLAAASTRSARAWEANLFAAGIPPPASRAHAPFRHHLLLHYESLAALGGRRFATTVEGKEHLHAALAQGKGLLVATVHVGNWHLGASTLHDLTGFPVHSVAGTQVLRPWTGELRMAYRHLGLRIHPRRGAGPRLLRLLRKGGIVALHLDGDQHAGRGLSTRGISLLARRAGAPVLPAVCTRSRAGTLCVRFRAPLGGRSAPPDPESLECLLIELVKDDADQWSLFRPLWIAA